MWSYVHKHAILIVTQSENHEPCRGKIAAEKHAWSNFLRVFIGGAGSVVPLHKNPWASR